MRPGETCAAGVGRDPIRQSGRTTLSPEDVASLIHAADQAGDSQQTAAAESTLLSARWFRFIFRWTLWHAVRYGHSVSLITIAAHQEHDGMIFAGSSPLLVELADTVGRVIRQTDLVGELEDGRLGIIVSDTDDEEAVAVVGRLIDLLSQVLFSTPLLMNISVASCPTNGSDIDDLLAHTQSHPMLNLRSAGVVAR